MHQKCTEFKGIERNSIRIQWDLPIFLLYMGFVSFADVRALKISFGHMIRSKTHGATAKIVPNIDKIVIISLSFSRIWHRTTWDDYLMKVLNKSFRIYLKSHDLRENS